MENSLDSERAYCLQRLGGLAGKTQAERIEEAALLLVGLNEPSVTAALDVIDQLRQPAQRR